MSSKRVPIVARMVTRISAVLSGAVLALASSAQLAAVELVRTTPAERDEIRAPSSLEGFSSVAGAMDRECLLEPSKTSDLGSPVRGVLSEVNVKRGDLVRFDQAVAQIDARAEHAAVKSARARLEYARRRVERNEELYKDDLISIQERDEIVTERELAELELKERETLLEMRTIRSPLDGVVVERVRSPGEFVEETEILKLASINPLNVEVVVPMALFGQVNKGMPATVTLVGPVEGTHDAKVVVVDRVIDAASGTFRVRLQIPNRSNRIPSGLRCQVEFPID